MSRATDRAWAAGLFEGEGSLSVNYNRNQRPHIQLSITSTDHDVIARFVETVGAGRVYGPYRQSRPGKPQYQWRAHGWELLKRLQQEWGPYLGARRSTRFAAVLALEPDPYVRVNRHQRKLTDDQVRDVRVRLGLGETQTSIARRHGTTQTTISHIKLGKTYREVSWASE